MAAVHLARAEFDGRTALVALKRLHPHLADEDNARRMLAREAELLARVRHPNVQRFIELGEVDGELYLATEYLEGCTLRELLQRSIERGAPVAPELIGAIAVEVLAALAYVHELKDEAGSPLGLVHRDLSPHNIFITTDGTAKLIDFGIALAVDHTRLTAAGVAKGNARYMSPEQLDARGGLDHQSDLFSLGVVLWEAFAGRALFQRSTIHEIFVAVMTAHVPRLDLLFEGGPKLERIIRRMLAKDRAQRPPSAAQLRLEIHGCFDARRMESAGARLRASIHELFVERIDSLEQPTVRLLSRGRSEYSTQPDRPLVEILEVTDAKRTFASIRPDDLYNFARRFSWEQRAAIIFAAVAFCFLLALVIFIGRSAETPRLQPIAIPAIDRHAPESPR